MTTFLTLNTDASISSTQNVLKAPIAARFAYTLSAVELKQSAEFTESLDAAESKTLVSSRRATTVGSSTELAVSQPLASLTTTFRIAWTGNGTNPLFRTARALTTTALTALTITRLSGTIARITQATAPFSTAAVVIGDYLLIEKTTDSFTSPFSTSNQGTPVKVVGKTATTIDVLDNGFMVGETAIVLGASFASVIKVFSASGVQVNDAMINKSSVFSAGNRGTFKVTSVSSDYVEIEADSLVSETVTGATSTEVYFANEVIRFLAITATNQIRVTIDGAPIETSVLSSGAFLSGTFQCTEILIENMTDLEISVSGIYASSAFENC